MTARLILGAALTLALSTTAFAQSYTAPAGIPSALAPGGLEGRAAVPNTRDAVERAPRAYDRGVYDAEDGLVTGSLRGDRDARAFRGR